MSRIVAVIALAAFTAPAPALGSSGREFWALHSDIHCQPGELYGLSVVVGNPDPVVSANVVVETEAGVVAAAAVAPRSAHAFDLGDEREVCFTDLIRAAYRVTSDVPVHAYQYRSYSFIAGEEAGSLLLPADRLGNDYLALAWPGDPGSASNERPSVVAVLAPGPVQVTVEVSSDTKAGPGVPALAAGATFTAALDAFDVLQLAGVLGADLTGTRVSATAPVEVFAGCILCDVASSAADTLFEVMMPVEWWGRTAVGAASNPLTADVNRWRILASEDGTEVVTEPAVPGTPATLARGQFLQFQSTTDFAVSASAPVLLARYNALGRSDPGGSDPAMALMLPPERFFRSAVFALPVQPFFMYHLVDVVARPGTAVTVDGTVVPPESFAAVGASGFGHAQVLLATDVETHSVDADQPVAVYATNAQSATAATFPLAIEPPPNLLPWCDAGGPYAAACSGVRTTVALDGSGSSDPEGAPLWFRWSSPSAAVRFDDSTLARPAVTVRGLGSFPVDLEVSDGRSRVTCSTAIELGGDPGVPPELSRLASPLWLVKRAGTAEVVFSWQDLGGAPMSYSVYQGRLKDFYSEEPLACNLGGSGSGPGRREGTLMPGPGSAYYYVSAANCAAEGPTGGDPGRSTCEP